MENDNEFNGEHQKKSAGEEKLEEIQKELQIISEKYGADILAAVNVTEPGSYGVCYVGEKSSIIRLGLAKVVEQYFIQ